MKAADLRTWILTLRARGCVRLELRHLAWSPDGGESGAPVDAWAYPETTKDAQRVADEVFAAARDDAADTGGLQRYALVALGEDEAAPLARKVWRVAGERTTEDQTATEPPTTAGITAQSMRHNEALMRVTLAKDEQVLQHLERLHEHALKRIAQLEARELAVMEAYEKLAAATHQREIETRRAESDAELRTRALAQLEPMIPLVLNRAFKLPLAPGAPTALDQLLATIEPEQVERLQSVLNPGQMMLLGEIYRERAAKTATSKPADPTKGEPS